jgi:hypothetical protein
MTLQIQFDDDRELEISPGSFVHTKDSDGWECYRGWFDLNTEEKQRLELLIGNLDEVAHWNDPLKLHYQSKLIRVF